jgi:hypothetical protein
MPSFTTSERDALAAEEGMMIYNSTTNQVERYEDTVWSAGAGTLPPGGSPEDYLKRTSTGYVWTTTTSATHTVGGLTTSGSIKNAADASKHYWGADDDYSAEWDGTNAVHTITDGAFVFDGGPMQMPTMSTTVRDALTPVDGMLIYNSTDEYFELYEEGKWNKKANVKTQSSSYHVSKTGNDTTGDGSVGNPWATFDKAYAVALTYVLLDQLYIYIGRGVYTETSELALNHPQGHLVNIIGEYYDEDLTLLSVNDTGSAIEYTYTTAHPEYYTDGYEVCVYESTGGANAAYAVGCQTVKGTTGTTVTFTYPVQLYGSLVASGAVVIGVVSPGVVWGRTIKVYENLRAIKGITNTLSGTVNTYFLRVTRCSADATACIFYNSHADHHGQVYVEQNAFCKFYKCGCRGLGHGIMVTISATAQVWLAGVTDCTYGLRCHGYSFLFFKYMHCIGCTTLGVYLVSMSCSQTEGVYEAFWGNATDSSPTLGSPEGNSNSYINY